MAIKKTFVLRTEATISSEKATLRFDGDNEIVSPMAIVENLYRYQGVPAKKKLAIKFLEYLSSFPVEKLYSSTGVKQENGSRLMVVDNENGIDDKIEKISNLSLLDKRVFQVCLNLKEKGKNVILISQNPIIRMKASKLGITAEPFKDEIFPNPQDQYTGRTEVFTCKNSLDMLFSQDKKLPIKEIYKHSETNWIENMFVLIKTETSSAIGRYTDGYIVPLQYSKSLSGEAQAMNYEQQMLMECLMAPPEIAPLVVAKGAAGTGKTFCSLAMALNKLERYNTNGIYRQLLVATPRVCVSEEEIGFLPGDVDDKVGPYLGGIKDNLKEIFRTSNPTSTINELNDQCIELFERGFIEIQPIGFLRGRTIPYTCFIIDETQNIRPEDIIDITTRAAKGSKFIFLGDPSQINNPYLNSRYNGLVYLSEKMKGSSLCWQVTLNSEKSVRSELAQLALQIL